MARRNQPNAVSASSTDVNSSPNGAANAYRLAELESRPAAEIDGLLTVEELRRRIDERRRQP